MDSSQYTNLLEAVAQVPDPRTGKGKQNEWRVVWGVVGSVGGKREILGGDMGCLGLGEPAKAAACWEGGGSRRCGHLALPGAMAERSDTGWVEVGRDLDRTDRRR